MILLSKGVGQQSVRPTGARRAMLAGLGTCFCGLALLLTVTWPSYAAAKDKDVCQTVRFANPGWSDLQISNGWSRALLAALGYKTTETNVSTTVTFASLSNKDLDVMLFDWMPANADLHKKYNGKFDMLGKTLPKVRYTLATTPTAYKAGLKTWQDIAKFKKELGGKIYGIEPGSGGNGKVAAFLKETGADKDIRMVESSTNAMLAEVERNKGGYIVYLAWEPHWMSKYDPQYLDGGDKWMGANQGSGLVNTLGRKDFKSDCPNLARFFKNFVLDINEENKLINAFEIEKKPVDQVVKNWLKANPTSVAKWLDGVKTFDDGDSMAAVKKSLGM